MPRLDVSAVFRNPDLTDRITVTRRTETVGDDGIAVLSAATHPAITAVVTPGLGRKMQNLEDLSSVQGVITVHTKFRLSDGKPNGKADLVTWHGADYVVINASDFTGFGAGFITAICQMQSLWAGSAAP